VRPTTASRASRIKKNGNWTDEQLKAALAAHDDGMSMKKTSNKFNIPYSSFREHLYGLRTSRVRGTKGALKVIEAMVYILEVLFGVLFGVLMEYSTQ
jgi:hypothetical protein